MADILTAAGTWLLAAITFYLVRGQIKESKHATGLQLFVQLTHDYQDPHMRTLRKALSSELLWYHQGEQPQKNPLYDESVLEFFENIAQLTKLEILDKQIVWSYFSVAVEGYWYAIRDLIAEMRKQENDEDLYRELEWLSVELSGITARCKGHSKKTLHSQEKITGYLQSEAGLYVVN